MGLCALAVAVVGLGLLATGCQPPPPPPGPVKVRLVNKSSFLVDANVYVSNAVVAQSQLFTSANFYDDWKGSRVFPTLQPGETVNFNIECDDVRTLGVSEPEFVSPVTGVSGGRSQDAIILQRPADFDCEQTVVFTYTAVPADERYEVASSVQ